MKLRFISLSILILSSLFKWQAQANEPDSAYLFAYGENGLRYAWSVDEQNWNSIGNEYVYLSSDFGRWARARLQPDQLRPSVGTRIRDIPRIAARPNHESRGRRFKSCQPDVFPGGGRFLTWDFWFSGLVSPAPAPVRNVATDCRQ